MDRLLQKLVSREENKLKEKYGENVNLSLVEIDQTKLLKKFSRSFYRGGVTSILDTLLRSVQIFQYAPIGPKLSEDQIANRLLKIGIVDNKNEAKELTQEVINREYPTSHHSSDGRKFDKIRMSDGSIGYCLFDKVWLD